MNVDGWLADTRTSYDTVAAGYADLVRDPLAGDPYQRAALASFAELVQAAGGGPVADVGCGPGTSPPTCTRSASTPSGSISRPG